ncbi:MAG TPA: D-aminoacyl-tRNA deacylase [Bacteroidales bacterium]|jgi:D-tyrosyl-tRNA(Tyr) deacylase|nr:D-aminoacyl-tRNA deacylase [Bacteroidales bacterium]HOS70867.1 D-aminoacyl-tRNA deacylase [Bacteroidales bacterium]HQH23148.1 D-aminoacyl-tRNA deacylase [Bacteroidales bacterium]HQJ80994.1 D-aminoacyl-tRNA deacylase [Bacteroidales bacterium]
MRAVIQRVRKSVVSSGEEILASGGPGMMILAGFEEADSAGDVEWLSNKIIQLRIFNDENGIMNLSVRETGGDITVVSQFTLHARTKKGNRPSYIRAASPEKAIPLYEMFVSRLTELLGKPVGTGRFGAMMLVEIHNDGPVTIIIDTRDKE